MDAYIRDKRRKRALSQISQIIEDLNKIPENSIQEQLNWIEQTGKKMDAALNELFPKNSE